MPGTNDRHSECQVQKSLMPKGVDHGSGLAECCWESVTVQKSLMPKGVDHLESARFINANGQVQKSLMPKGVDHNNVVFLGTHTFTLCKNL